MGLASSSPIFNVSCKLACSFLDITAPNSFLRLGTILSQAQGQFWVSLSKSSVSFIMYFVFFVSVFQFQ